MKVFNQRIGLAPFCPTTSRVEGYPFVVMLPEGLPLSGVLLADQVMGLDWRSRRAELACEMPDDVVIRLIAKLST